LRRKRLRTDRRLDVLANLREPTIVDMNGELRRRVKYLIIVVVDAPGEIGGKLSGRGEILF